jgi:hypothetical protein
VALLVVLSICLLLRLAQFLPPGEMKGDSVYDHLQLGMPRTEIRPYMHHAWRRYECKFGDSVREVYLFGSRGRVSESYVIELIFDEQDGAERLTLFGDVDYYELSLPVSDDCDIYESPWETLWPNLFLVVPPAR